MRTVQQRTVRVDILDDDGAETLYAGRDAAWLIAVAAQVDEDAAADRLRTERAYADLLAAVTALGLVR